MNECSIAAVTCLTSSSDAVAVAVAATVRAKVDQQSKPQPKPVQAHDAPWKDGKIRQGRPRYQNGAQHRPDPERQGEMERPGLRVEGEIEARRIHKPPDQNSEPRTEKKQGGDETAHGFLLCSGIASRLARNDPAAKPRIPSWCRTRIFSIIGGWGCPHTPQLPPLY